MEIWKSYRWMLGAVAVLAILASGNTLRVIRQERRQHLENAVTETNQALAAQVRSELDLLLRDLTELAETRLKPRVAAGEADSFAAELDRDVLSVSLWKRGAEGGALKRVAVALNSSHVTPAQSTWLESQAGERAEAELGAPALAGKTVISLARLPDSGTAAAIAFPLGNGVEPTELLVAHVRLSLFQRAFRATTSVRAFLVTSEGELLAHSEDLASHPLVEPLRREKGLVGAGTLQYLDHRGERQFGAYRVLAPARVAVITQASPTPAAAGGTGEAIFSVALLLLAFIAGLGLPGLRLPVLIEARAPLNRDEEPSLGLSRGTLQVSKERVVSVLCGSVFQVEELASALGPEVAVNALNEFLTAAAGTVKGFGGEFERNSGSTFVAIWSRREGEENENLPALRCALELRQDFIRFNELRKTDGERPLALGMGLDTGVAIAGKIGPAAESKFSIVGDVLSRARKLDQLSTTLGTDLLLSEEAWNAVRERAVGQRAGEGKLSAESGFQTLFRIDGTRDPSGVEKLVPSSWKGAPVPVAPGLVDPEVQATPAAERRWLVNNGSQIIGPLDAKEIAGQLFAQELDFDSECWVDGTGEPSQLGKAGIFSGTAVDGAELWLYDEGAIHGPMTAAFLKAALVRGAITENAHLCERSTVLGWRKVSDWAKPEVSEPEQGSAPEPADWRQTA
ncbi:MAG: adenylate/guanylate cyclase domain-containing protein [Oligoflexia bacterium]|nr:adenylate/guanylate cyclase domain-containing protein [Oligoflexia bacterium]